MLKRIQAGPLWQPSGCDVGLNVPIFNQGADDADLFQ
jgi:hypothetical protein